MKTNTIRYEFDLSLEDEDNIYDLGGGFEETLWYLADKSNADKYYNTTYDLMREAFARGLAEIEKEIEQLEAHDGLKALFKE